MIMKRGKLDQSEGIRLPDDGRIIQHTAFTQFADN